MPHLKIEHSSNVVLPADKIQLLKQLHLALVDITAVKVSNIKSRIFCIKHYLVDLDNTDNGFIHLDLRLMEGRSTQIIKQIGNQMKQILMTACLPLNSQP